jgi:DNA-directed RNA polymerase subunit omega
MTTPEFDSNYRYVLVAARRARQLLSGARPAIETSSRKPCKIAMEEIRAGKVRWNDPAPERSAVEVASQLLDKAMEPGPGE